MELRHLRYFVALAESLHFGHAAAELHIAQPSLSHQIRQLETELHTTLLQRTKRRVELTDAGRLFLQEARDIVARADRAALIARRVGGGESGRLRIGVGYCMDHLDVSKAVSAFGRQYQTVHVQLRTMSVPSQFDALQADRLDVGFIRPPVTEGVLSSEALVSEPLMVALPKGHRLAARPAIALPALAHEAFIVPPRDSVPVYHDIVLKTCREAGFVPNAPHEADHLPMVLGMVAAGSGVALVPGFARRPKPSGVVLVPLRPSPPTLEMVVAWRRDDPSPTIAEFVKVARRILVRAGKRTGA